MTARDRKAPVGSGPGGAVTREDVERALRRLGSEVTAPAQAALPDSKTVWALGVLALVVVAWLLGRRHGRLRSTIVEVRRV